MSVDSSSLFPARAFAAGEDRSCNDGQSQEHFIETQVPIHDLSLQSHTCITM